MNTTEACKVEIPELTGKTVARAYQESGEFHALDGGYAQDGTVIVEFTDGTRLAVLGAWCNDNTASTDYEVACPPPAEIG